MPFRTGYQPRAHTYGSYVAGSFWSYVSLWGFRPQGRRARGSWHEAFTKLIGRELSKGARFLSQTLTRWLRAMPYGFLVTLGPNGCLLRNFRRALASPHNRLPEGSVRCHTGFLLRRVQTGVLYGCLTLVLRLMHAHAAARASVWPLLGPSTEAPPLPTRPRHGGPRVQPARLHARTPPYGEVEGEVCAGLDPHAARERE